MKKVILIVIMLTLSISTVLMADSRYRMIGKLWQRHEDAVTSSFQCWKYADNINMCKSQLEDIILTESELLAYGVSPTNENLYASLAKDMDTVNWNKLIIRIFLKKFEKISGWAPDLKKEISIENPIRVKDKDINREFSFSF